ncbi:MAG: hypothetical protein K2U26_04485, partial [Cyclobacteriaceae bacterium]|nr:hypothetical protein [Chitinophagaceae bacterium]MBY0433349.1 hypothetical protein [Cyclobacteriaceae bacterium]
MKTSMLLSFITSFCGGQDTVKIKSDFRQQETFPFTRYFKSTTIVSPDSAYQFLLQHSQLTQKQTDPFIGIVREPYWFLTEFKNESNDTEFIFEIQHSHLRHIDFYEIHNSHISYKNTVGELHPFNNRPIHHRHFSFPVKLERGQAIGVLLYVDQQNSLGMPTRLWSSVAFHAHDYNFNLMAGMVIGFLIFCFFISIVAFAFIRQVVFGWYAVYLFFTTVYIFTDLGLSFQYIFPTLTRVDGPLSVYAPLLVFVGLTKFVIEFLSLKKTFKGIYYFLTGLILFLLLLIVIDLIFQESFRQFSFYVLPVVFGLILVGLLVIFVSGIMSFLTNRKIAVYLLAS